MKANYKQKLQQKQDQIIISAYSILYARRLMNVIPNHIKTKRTIRGLGLALLKDFDGLLKKSKEEIADGLYELDRVVNNLGVADIIDTADIREIAYKQDIGLKTFYKFCGAMFTISYYNVIDDWIKTPETQTKLLRDTTTEYNAMCLTGLKNFGWNGIAFANRIFNDADKQMKEKGMVL